MPKTKTIPMVYFTTRNLEQDLRDRLRVVAALLTVPDERMTMDDVLNRALRIGLKEMEKVAFGRLRK